MNTHTHTPSIACNLYGVPSPNQPTHPPYTHLSTQAGKNFSLCNDSTPQPPKW
ncbi:hypothetical protein BO78DRAFT_393315 [Aspergillus sclerotiicarbonarius CBS 121057]|uniref:Uncharacterized protein n=1 Tax=Aspergillus sclerotiicarbonarius (strain CBS 121057 / IBT 28362) TaxID=1448318 RepID=A0A319ETI8_ASPSB|nr:hypothetical protein BO78DRAFT_393315 [Aspergillus sclerotiicarbonarius CBS 121057]